MSMGRVGLAPTGKAPPYHGAHPKETLALPQNFKDWSMTTMREKLIKIGSCTSFTSYLVGKARKAGLMDD